MLAVFGSTALLSMSTYAATSANAKTVNDITASQSRVSVSSCTGWSPIPPSECHNLKLRQAAPTALKRPNWNGGSGCSGYYTGPNIKEMICRDTAISTRGYQIAIRYGFWDGSNGFGWSKAYYYHDLWMQPMIDTIKNSVTITGPPSSKNYEEFHYNIQQELDQEVIVVADTQDNRPVGVITGYCLTPAGAEERACPPWVNSTL